MEDIRLGRSSFSTYGEKALAAGSAQVFVGFNPRRTRLFVSADGIADVALGPEEHQPGTDHGIVISTQVPYILLKIEDIGPIICSAWYAHPGAGTNTLHFIDVSQQKE